MKRATLGASGPVLVDLDSLARSSSGKVIGSISLSVKGHRFPEECWSDFPVILLQMWLPISLALWRGAPEARFRFMDGPFWFDVSNVQGMWRFRCIDDHGRESVVATEDLAPIHVMRNMAYCSRGVVRVCRYKKWVTDDLIRLESDLKQSLNLID